jgi:Transposase zinc-ribbon domain
MPESYPENLVEFEERFSTEEQCRDYLFRLRWPQGFVCQRCEGQKAWQNCRRHWVCCHCGYQASLTAGTLFQDTHKPLRLWFRAMWSVTSQKQGASALGVQRVLGLGGYITAWSWLHKLRRAMVRPGRDRLNGEVEVDETYIGGLSESRQENRKDSIGPSLGRFGRELGTVHPASCGTGHSGPYRRLARIQGLGEAGLPAPSRSVTGKAEIGRRRGVSSSSFGSVPT